MTKPPRKPAKSLLREAETPLRSQPRRRRDTAQPQLPFDPMPVRVDPCLALLKQRPPKGSDWVFEISGTVIDWLSTLNQKASAS